MTPVEMKALCTAEIDQWLADFDKEPDQALLLDLSAAAETLVLCGGIESTKALREKLSRAALGWAREGLLDDLLFARPEYLSHTSLFCYFASLAPDFQREDVAPMNRLVTNGLAGRSELPVINLQIIAAYLAAAGIKLGSAETATRDLRLVIDRRVLRPRSDEHDILTLTRVAQLFKLGALTPEHLPRSFPQTVLVQSIRQGNVNWISILTLLCSSVYTMPGWLRDGATEALASHLAQATGLLPPPDNKLAENDHVQSDERGLRIRSSIASFALLHE